ncbi:MAG: hypothetical protein ACKO9Z_10625 [Planctomycetota bacterium]
MTGIILMVALAPVAEPGPGAGKPCPALRAHMVKKDESADLLAGRMEAPSVVVLVRAEKFDRPLARVLRELDRESFRVNPDARVLMVFLASDRKMWRERLVLVDKSLQLDNTILGVTDEEKLMSDWGASVDHAATVVVVSQGKVIKGFGFASGADGESAVVLKAIPKAK